MGFKIFMWQHKFLPNLACDPHGTCFRDIRNAGEKGS